MNWMISCKKASRLASEKMEHSLSFSERILLKMHMIICKTCIQVEKQIKDIQNILKNSFNAEENLTLNEKLPEQIFQKIKKLLKEKI